MKLSKLLEQQQGELVEIVFQLNSESNHDVALKVQALLVAIDDVSNFVAEEGLEDTPIEVPDREC